MTSRSTTAPPRHRLQPAVEATPATPAAATEPYRPGDAADFDRLYRASYSRVRATLMGMLHDPAAAEDCAQEAFARALRSWSRWRPEAPAEAWVHRIAVNVAISHRRRHRFAAILHERLRARGDGPEHAIDREDLLAALRALPPRQAAAVVLRHLHGYTNREIAIALGVPERTVASRLATARERLQRELGWKVNPNKPGTSPAPRVVSGDEG